MNTKSRHQRWISQNRQKKRHVELGRVSPFHVSQQEIPPQQERSVLRRLQDALWDVGAIISVLWNYRTGDWVTGVHAADIDNDGDIEVILGSRDGIVRVHTPWGAKKWEVKWDGQSISALFAIPVTDVPLSKKAVQKQACVIVGMRDGRVYAL